MPESIIITLQKTMLLTERISEANKRISERIETLEKPFNGKTGGFQLTKIEQNEIEYIYHYIIVRDVETTERKRRNTISSGSQTR